MVTLGSRLLFIFLSSQILTSTSTPIRSDEGIILSGGDVSQSSVEVYVPSTGQSCALPALPDRRSRHTMDSLLICGGDAASHTCLSFSSGQWVTSHTLAQGRDAHSSWQTEQGVVLMGGFDSPKTSEVVALGGDQGEPSFDMKYPARGYCAIPDMSTESVIVTGGSVSRYDMAGFVESLPVLNMPRSYHGCGGYMRDGRQVFLVAGGVDTFFNYLSSAEVMTTDTGVWALTTPLPRALSGVGAVTLVDRLFITGGRDEDTNDRDEVLAWVDEDQEWVEEGRMMIARSAHAVTTIKMDDQAMENCV